MDAAPRVWLGAPSKGGLALPDAKPSASQLYAPRGVWLDDRRLIVVDSGNHRVLVWNHSPDADHAPADVVLGQPSFESEGPRAAGRGAANGLHLPTGVLVVDGRLFVADAWHHRVLVWNRVPEVSDTPPDVVLGQPDSSSIEPNAGGSVSASTFYWPYGIGCVAGRFIVTDTGNRRVLIWDGVPEPGQPADVVLGQDSSTTALENRGGPPTARSFRWPHAVAGDERRLWVADAGNHRVLGWNGTPDGDVDAAEVLGQPDFAHNGEFPYRPQTARMLRFPYSVASDATTLIVADTANNRVLVHPVLDDGRAADAVLALGQPDLASNGENRWRAVAADTLCWPYGVALWQGLVAVADSGNNRVMLWRLERPAARAAHERTEPTCV
ncbi:MAG: NHL repeat-containing protein [Vicinamibacterales bacterium]